jgi:hypothetical protein
MIPLTMPLLVVVSCQPIGIADQVQLSRPIYDFNGGGTRSYDCGLSRQIETGRSDSSNVSAGGCASCN